MGLGGIKEVLQKVEKAHGLEGQLVALRTRDKVVPRALATVAMFDASQLLHKLRDIESGHDLVYKASQYLAQFALVDDGIVLLFFDDRDKMPVPRAYTNLMRGHKAAKSSPSEDMTEDSPGAAGGAAAAAAMVEEEEEPVEIIVTHERISPPLNEIVRKHRSYVHLIMDLLVEGLEEHWAHDDPFTLGIARNGKWEVVKGGSHTREFLEWVVVPSALERLGEADTKMVHAALRFASLEEPMHVILVSTDWDILLLLLLCGVWNQAWDIHHARSSMLLHWVHWVLHPPTKTKAYMATVVDVERIAYLYYEAVYKKELAATGAEFHPMDFASSFMDLALLVALTGTDYGKKMASLETPTLLEFAFGLKGVAERQRMIEIMFDDGLPFSVELDTGALFANIRWCFRNQRSRSKKAMTVGEIESAIRSAVWWVMYSLMPKWLWLEPLASAFGYRDGLPTVFDHAEFHDPADMVPSFVDELENESCLFDPHRGSAPLTGRKGVFPIYY